MVEYSDSMAPASDEQIDDLEKRVGLSFPSALRRLFREANGGRPSPYVYRDDNNDTDVSECLAIRDGKGSALWTYELLVQSKHLVPKQFFPLQWTREVIAFCGLFHWQRRCLSICS